MATYSTGGYEVLTIGRQKKRLENWLQDFEHLSSDHNIAEEKRLECDWHAETTYDRLLYDKFLAKLQPTVNHPKSVLVNPCLIRLLLYLLLLWSAGSTIMQDSEPSTLHELQQQVSDADQIDIEVVSRPLRCSLPFPLTEVSSSNCQCTLTPFESRNFGLTILLGIDLFHRTLVSHRRTLVEYFLTFVFTERGRRLLKTELFARVQEKLESPDKDEQEIYIQGVLDQTQLCDIIVPLIHSEVSRS